MIHIITGIPLLILGYLVKYKQWSWLIAGYNTSSKKEKEKYDKTALCNAIGNLLFILAAIVFIGSLGDFLDLSWLINASWIVFTIIIVVFVIYANTGNRFKK